MPEKEIQWFPGHMQKTRYLIAENLRDVDLVLELRDARIPESSRNPEIYRLTEGKPLLTLLNKASLADPEVSRSWLAFYKKQGRNVLLTDCTTGEGVSSIRSAARSILREKLAHWEERGLKGKHIRLMILGIPNVGKSSLLNRLAGQKLAKTENRPGVTRDKQWVTAGDMELLDMPGVLWPKFGSRRIAEHLAFTGTIRKEILDEEELAAKLALRLRELYPQKLAERYKLDAAFLSEAETGYRIVEEIARRRGFLVSGGEPDTARAALTLLDEFRCARIGRISLERPEDADARI
ncbi:MAG: ribosome biogenesis GTPase YlqF [Clostridia bacterium]|nr:ribosome biogenesis GTPase YlqF [Clostridia bacterium]